MANGCASGNEFIELGEPMSHITGRTDLSSVLWLGVNADFKVFRVSVTFPPPRNGRLT